MLVTPSGIVILVRLVQSEKVLNPILVSLLFSSKVMFVRLVHCTKVKSPILVKLSGIVMLVRPQP